MICNTAECAPQLHLQYLFTETSTYIFDSWVHCLITGKQPVLSNTEFFITVPVSLRLFPILLSDSYLAVIYFTNSQLFKSELRKKSIFDTRIIVHTAKVIYKVFSSFSKLYIDF